MMKAVFVFQFTLFCFTIFSQKEKYDPPGKMVDMGGYKIHLLTAGEDHSVPTVVFFHGAGDIGLIWNLVLPEVGRFAKAVAVDQNGEGWSEHGFGANLNQQVFDTRKALSNAGFPPPYILVGHSLGGILANLFAAKYRNEVKGLVMVDATHPDVVLKIFNKKTKAFEWKKMRLNANEEIPPPITKNLDTPHEIKSFQPRKDFGKLLNEFSESDKKRFHWVYNVRPWTYVKGHGNTYEAEVFEEMYQNKKKYRLADIPLIVISAGKKQKQKGDTNWSANELKEHSKFLQKDLLNLSTNSEHILAKKSGHYVHIDQPELVVNAIKKILQNL